LPDFSRRWHRFLFDACDRRNVPQHAEDQIDGLMDVGRSGMILQHDWDGDLLADTAIELQNAIVVRDRLFCRRHHHRARSQVLRPAREIGRSVRAAVARPDDDRDALFHGLDRGLDQPLTLLIAQTIRFAKHAENRDAVDAKADHELEEPSPRIEIERLIIMKGGRQDWNNTGEGHGE